MPDRIVLISGAAPWLSRLQFVLVVLAVVAIAITPTPPVWQAGALLALATFTRLERRWSAGRQNGGTLCIRLDGTVLYRPAGRETKGILAGAAWASSRFCVVHWTPFDSTRRRHSLVCASLNREDDYRRLLVFLRLGGLHDPGAHAL